MVAPQVDDERIGASDQFHRRGDGRAGVVRVSHPAQVQVADVARQPLDPVNAVVVRMPSLAAARPALVPAALAPGPGPALRPGRLAPGRQRRHHPYPQVLVRADLVEVIGKPLRERGLVEAVVPAGGQPRLDHRGGLLGAVGKYVVAAEQRQRGLHDLGPGQRRAGQRGVVRHRDPGAAPGSAAPSTVNSSSRAGGSLSDSSRRIRFIPAW
jgi:hypothetical protein